MTNIHLIYQQNLGSLLLQKVTVNKSRITLYTCLHEIQHNVQDCSLYQVCTSRSLSKETRRIYETLVGSSLVHFDLFLHLANENEVTGIIQQLYCSSSSQLSNNPHATNYNNCNISRPRQGLRYLASDLDLILSQTICNIHNHSFCN